MLKNYEAPEILLLELFSKEDILTESPTTPSESDSESQNGSYDIKDGGGL